MQLLCIMNKMPILYEQLGNLFYSIAAADKRITREEVNKLQDTVSKYWLPLEKSRDNFGTDAAHYINITFDYLLEEMPASAEAYERFEAFYKDNPKLFTDLIRLVAMDTARDIACSYSQLNKAEAIALAKLEILFSRQAQ